MDILAYNPEGKSVVCEKGELVCATPFPSTPIYFWNDKAAEKYHQAYFEQFPEFGHMVILSKLRNAVV